MSPACQGVKVELYLGSGVKVAETTTGANGPYLFDNLTAGEYYVKFIKPAGYISFSPKDVGDNAMDSDADTTTGQTAKFNLAWGQTDLTWDAGLNRGMTPATSGRLRLVGPERRRHPERRQHRRQRGQGGTAEQRRRGAESTTTATGGPSSPPGWYQFANQTPGVYQVRIAQQQLRRRRRAVRQAGHAAGSGADDAKDSDGDRVTYKTGLIVLYPGGNNQTVDFGFRNGQDMCVPEVTSGPVGTLFLSTNANGDLVVRYAQARGVNDNSYGTAAVGWPGGHKFGDLVGSDMAQFQVKDATGKIVLDFKVDYISTKSGTPSGYASLGVSGGEGGMIVGSASHILSAHDIAGLEPELRQDQQQHAVLHGRRLHGQRRQPAGQLAADRQQHLLHPAGRLALRPVGLHQLVRGDDQQGGVRRTAGFGSVAVVSQHNSPAKVKVDSSPQPCVPGGGSSASFTCSKPFNALTMRWDGTAPVKIVAWKGAVGAPYWQDRRRWPRAGTHRHRPRRIAQ